MMTRASRILFLDLWTLQLMWWLWSLTGVHHFLPLSYIFCWSGGSLQQRLVSRPRINVIAERRLAGWGCGVWECTGIHHINYRLPWYQGICTVKTWILVQCQAVASSPSNILYQPGTTSSSTGDWALAKSQGRIDVGLLASRDLGLRPFSLLPLIAPNAISFSSEMRRWSWIH